MRVAEQARQLAGVTEVAVVMGTPPGRSMLTEAGMWPVEAPEAGPSDLLISVRASTDTVANRALACVEELLSASRDSESARVDVPPRTTLSAARGSRATNVALIAVRGGYAAIDAHQALSAGLHVFLFSDGVSVDDEVALKRRAGARGLLVMGPECGTSIINGVGLGFANRVRRGPIGVIGASGTGLQEVTSLIHRFGAGVSHAIGTGGRDLHAAVGGLTTLQAVGALAADVDTRVLLIVSKPPSPAVADAVLRNAAIVGTADEPRVSVLLLDLVLGDCAHADPAGALRPALAEARARRSGLELAVVAHVVGTDQDPQGLERQEKSLRELGAIVCASNRIAAETARAIAEGRDAA